MVPDRIYILDDADRIPSVIERDCPDDHAALAAAREATDVNAVVEVWQLGRCLGTVHGGR
jgi:hypothetical protein